MKDWTGAAWTGGGPAGEESGATGNLVLPARLERTVRAFLIGASCWRWSPAGLGAIPLGFDYTGLRNGCAMAGLRLTPAEFEDLREMERTARAGLAEKAR